MIYAQINSITHVIEQFVGFNGDIDPGHIAANPQAYFVEAAEMGTPKTHAFDVELGAIVRKPHVERVTKHSWDEQRRRAYPSINEQLDALWKGGAAAAAMKAQIDEVKQRHPKP